MALTKTKGLRKICLEAARQGDIGDRRLIRLDGIDSLDTFSSGAFHIQRGATVVDLAVTVADSAKRTVWVNLGTAGGWLPSNPAVGEWIGEVEITFLDSSRLTWPNDAYYSLQVLEQIA